MRVFVQVPVLILAGAVLAGPAPGGEVLMAEPPVLERVEPNTAAVEGGARIAVLGAGFDTAGAAPVRVLVGGQACVGVTVHSSDRMTAVVPASRTAGAVDVEVQNADGQRAVLAGGFCYDDGRIWLAKWYRVKARVGAAWTLLRQGGSLMIVLGALSVFGLAWAVHCALVVRARRVMPGKFLEAVRGQISRGEVDEAMESCRRDGCVLGRVLESALRRAGQPAVKIREAAEATGSREAAHLFQKISYLSNVGVISPMVGLLGTVVGMTMAFKTISVGEAGGRHLQLARAIHLALITTVAGLTIGIPAMASFYYFRGKLLRIVTEMEQVAEDMAEGISGLGVRK